MQRRVTIREVAELAGCSASTVSRVLNDSGQIGQDTRARVKHAAETLEFRFDPIGRSLQSQRTRTIGLMIPTLSNPVFAQAIDGVQATLRARGYQLLLACSNYAAEDEAEAVSTLLAHRVDGLILTVSDPDLSPAIDMAEGAGAPFVLIFNHPATDLPAVAFDNRAAAAEVAHKMHALGHTRTAFVAGRFSTSDRSKQRYLGFSEGAVGLGTPEPALLEVDYDAASHRDALAHLLASEPDITGLFCSNDMLALKVIGDLRRLGKRVPQDISVVGFDGLEMGTLVEPTLATVATPCEDMGATAARRLTDTLNQVSENQTTDKQTSEHLDTIRVLAHRFRPGGTLSRAPDGTAGSRAATLDPAPTPADPRLMANQENER